MNVKVLLEKNYPDQVCYLARRECGIGSTKERRGFKYENLQFPGYRYILLISFNMDPYPGSSYADPDPERIVLLRLERGSAGVCIYVQPDAPSFPLVV
jgi:hypothetical protein